MLLELLARGKHLAVLPDLPLSAANGDGRFARLDFNANQTTERNLYLWVRDEFDGALISTTLCETLKQRFAKFA